jgi:DNA invertase Pin-like site-specific DNA recombinase
MTTTPAIGYSYIRFSSPAQAEGDSLRRQTEAARQWCEKNAVCFDTTTTLHDLGKSAYTGAHRKNPDRHALAAFLKLVEQGKIPRGSYLIIENLDRLSREHIRSALTLLLNLIESGVRVVQLKPAVTVFDDDVDPYLLMMAIMELARGHGESKLKSERVGEAWAEKKRLAREGKNQPPRRKDGRVTKALTDRLPAWVEEKGGQLVLIPRKAAAVRQVILLAAAGYGINVILKRLADDKVEPIGRSGRWTHSYVGLLLKDRNVIGELQPRRRDGTPDGPVIPDYYPAVVTLQEWHAARAGAAQRKKRPGKVGNHLNVFAGLMREARNGEVYYEVTCHGRNGNRRVLVNADGHLGRAPWRSFPAGVFERAVLAAIREINPHDILNGDEGPDEALVLAGELARVDSKIAELEAELLVREVATLAKVLHALEAQQRDLSEKLAEARQRAAHPLSESWGQCQSLVDTLEMAPDPLDARLRLRSALRRMIDTIMTLVVARGKYRLAAVQIWFTPNKDGKQRRRKQRRRDYLILAHPARGNGKATVPARWWCRSFADVIQAGDLDLRDRGHAERLERALLKLDLSGLTE